MSSPTRSWSSIQEILGRALTIEGEARSSYLQEACGEDTALRREIESYLDADEGKIERLEDGLRRLAGGPPRLGLVLGPYRLDREIGRGGMGVVYLAERIDGSHHRRVAIKILQQRLRGDSLLLRFRDEQQILATLEHPHIVTLHDAGETKDGLPYFVMEHVDGVPIHEYCRSQELSIPNRLRLFRQVCDAVQVAHQHTVVHRDLKPSNIMVTKVGRPKLLDFGIAKVLDREVSEARTETGDRLMTLRYASPEQVLGRPISVASDVYSLGVVLYELLTGRHPQEMKDLSRRRAEEAICSRAPHRTNLASDLERILLMALHKEPGRRYQTAADLALDIGRYLNGQPIEARGDAPLYRAMKFATRHRVAVAFATVALLVLTGFGLALVAQQRKTVREKNKAEQISQFMIDLFSKADPVASEGGTPTAKDLLDLGKEKIPELDDLPEIQAAWMAAMGEAYAGLGLYPQADELLSAVLEGHRERGAAKAELGESLLNLGRLRILDGKYEEGEDLVRESLALLEAAFGKNSLEAAEASNVLGLAHRRQEEIGEALSAYERALAIRIQNLGPEDLLVAQSHNNVALCLESDGDFGAAEERHREAIRIRRKQLPPDHPWIAQSLNNLAYTLHSLDRSHEAELFLREALEIRRRAYGEGHPFVAQGLNNLGFILRARGAYVEAEPLFRQAVLIWRERLDPNHADLAKALSNLTGLLVEIRITPELEVMQREVLSIDESRRGREDLLVADDRRLLGRILTQLGDLEGGRRHLAEAEATFRANAALADTRFVYLLRDRAALERTAGNLREARTIALRGLELCEEAREPRFCRGILKLSLAETGLQDPQQGSLHSLPGPTEDSLEELLRDVLSLFEDELPEGHWWTAQARGLLGLAYLRDLRPREAKPLLESSHQVLEARLGPDAPRTVRAAARLEELQRKLTPLPR